MNTLKTPCWSSRCFILKTHGEGVGEAQTHQTSSRQTVLRTPYGSRRCRQDDHRSQVVLQREPSQLFPLEPRAPLRLCRPQVERFSPFGPPASGWQRTETGRRCCWCLSAPACAAWTALHVWIRKHPTNDSFCFFILKNK